MSIDHYAVCHLYRTDGDPDSFTYPYKPSPGEESIGMYVSMRSKEEITILMESSDGLFRGREDSPSYLPLVDYLGGSNINVAVTWKEATLR